MSTGTLHAAAFSHLSFSLFFQESGLELADVVEFDPVAQPWNKLGGGNHFNKFHAIFWMKTLKPN